MNYELTTEHPSSNYGIPVLIVDGTAYGAMDELPNGNKAFYFVQDLEHELKTKFLQSAPDLYFNL